MIFGNRVKSAEDLAKQMLLTTSFEDRPAVFSTAKRTAEEVSKLSSSAYKKDAYIAALLHKTGKDECLAAGKKPLPLGYIEKFFGPKVESIVKELQTAPTNRDDLALWAKTLSLEAQEILMAQDLAAMKEGAAPRLIIINALKDANPKMYAEALKLSQKQPSPPGPFSLIKNFFAKKGK